MRASVFIIFLTVLISFKSYSQASFGFKAGMNYSNVAIVDKHLSYKPNGNQTVFLIDNSRFKPGYHFGFYSSIKLKNKFSINPELLFSNKGHRGISDQDANLHLNYLNVPLLLGYEPIKKLNILLGTEFGYLLNAKSRYKSSSRDVGDTWNNKFDFGISLGIKYALTEKFSAELRYNYGLSSVMKDVQVPDELSHLEIDIDAKFQNRTAQFSIAYKLR